MIRKHKISVDKNKYIVKYINRFTITGYIESFYIDSQTIEMSQNIPFTSFAGTIMQFSNILGQIKNVTQYKYSIYLLIKRSQTSKVVPTVYERDSVESKGEEREQEQVDRREKGLNIIVYHNIARIWIRAQLFSSGYGSRSK